MQPVLKLFMHSGTLASCTHAVLLECAAAAVGAARARHKQKHASTHGGCFGCMTSLATGCPCPHAFAAAAAGCARCPPRASAATCTWAAITGGSGTAAASQRVAPSMQQLHHAAVQHGTQTLADPIIGRTMARKPLSSVIWVTETLLRCDLGAGEAPPV